MTDCIKIVDKLFEKLTKSSREETFQPTLIELMNQLSSLSDELERWINHWEKIREGIIKKFSVLSKFELRVISLVKSQQ